MASKLMLDWWLLTYAKDEQTCKPVWEKAKVRDSPSAGKSLLHPSGNISPSALLLRPRFDRNGSCLIVVVTLGEATHPFVPGSIATLPTNGHVRAGSRRRVRAESRRLMSSGSAARPSYSRLQQGLMEAAFQIRWLQIKQANPFGDVACLDGASVARWQSDVRWPEGFPSVPHPSLRCIVAVALRAQ